MLPYILHRSHASLLSLPPSPEWYFLLYLRIPPPLISQLFPYTTLFRSQFSRYGPASLKKSCSYMAVRLWKSSGGWGHAFIDRKSTRLNSSHITISYAVFCLKKKIKASLSADHLGTLHSHPCGRGSSSLA